MSRAFFRYGLISAVVFAVLFILLRYRLHFFSLWAYLSAINLVGFGMYAMDKFAAKRVWLRVPEMLLQLLALLGATPAAVFAQQLFWHKTTKRSFQVFFWMIALFQLLVLYAVVFTDLLQNIF